VWCFHFRVIENDRKFTQTLAAMTEIAVNIKNGYQYTAQDATSVQDVEAYVLFKYANNEFKYP
jgi:phosphoribosylformylglycinamidine (FGAM) synthase-like amidotransferase family enzyme